MVVNFADIRILAFGTLTRPRGPFSVNRNAHILLHPPGVDNDLAPVKRPFGESLAFSRSSHFLTSKSSVTEFLRSFEPLPPLPLSLTRKVSDVHTRRRRQTLVEFWRVRRRWLELGRDLHVSINSFAA